MAVPSLNSASPLMSMVRRWLAPSSLRMATTATGSVAARIAPNASARFQSQLYGNTNFATRPSSTTVKMTPKDASSRHCQIIFFTTW